MKKDMKIIQNVTLLLEISPMLMWCKVRRNGNESLQINFGVYIWIELCDNRPKSR